MEKNKPHHTIRVGQGIKATIWPNEGQQGTWFNVSVSRTYKNGDGQLKDSTSFTRDQLPHVAFAVARAYQFLLDQGQSD